MNFDQLIGSIVQRVMELDLKPGQHFNLVVSKDIIDAILRQCDSNGTRYMQLADGSYTFFQDIIFKWSPKIYVNDKLKEGNFNITLV